MKRFFAFLCAAAMIVACTEPITEDPPVTPETPETPAAPEITIEEETPPSFTNEGGESVIEFTAPEPWVIEIENITRAEDWITVEPMSGDAGQASITITTTPNDTYDDREATITIKAGTLEETFTITQSQLNGLVSAEKEFEIDFNGGVIDFEIQTNVEFTVTISEDAKEWITQVEDTRGLEKKALTFDIAAHKSTADRSGEITIAGGGLEQKIVINQVYPVPANEIWYTSTDGEIVTPSLDNAFNVTILSNEYKNGKGVIKFSGDLITIGQNAFAAGGKAKNLKSILLPNSVTEIGNYAFGEGMGPENTLYRCPITEIIIPESVTTLGYNPFRNCVGDMKFYGKYASKDHKSLIKDDVLVSYVFGEATEVTIPEGVKELGNLLFYNGYNLKKVTFSNSVTTIGESAFAYSGLESLDIPANITTISKQAFAGCNSLTEVNIPSTVTTIGEKAFLECMNISSLTLNEGIKTIGAAAFASIKISEVTIPNSVEELGEGAFRSNHQLSSFSGKFATEDGNALIVGSKLINFAINGSYIEEYTIPSSVTEIGAYAFMDVTRLGKIIIPDSVTKVGDYGLAGLRDTEIVFGDNIKEIGKYGFGWSFVPNYYEDPGPMIVTLPAKLEIIGDNAFFQTNIEQVIIPDGVKSIGKRAFGNCFLLWQITSLSTTPPAIEADTFVNANISEILVPAESVEAYKQAAGWSDYADFIIAIE